MFSFILHPLFLLHVGIGFGVGIVLARRCGVSWWGNSDGKLDLPACVVGFWGIVLFWPIFLPGVIAGEVAHSAHVARLSMDPNKNKQLTTKTKSNNKDYEIVESGEI